MSQQGPTPGGREIAKRKLEIIARFTDEQWQNLLDDEVERLNVVLEDIRRTYPDLGWPEADE